MAAFLSVCLGLGLSAACGFRIFVPLLVMSVAAHQGWLHLADSFSWIGSQTAMIAFAVATALEIGAYYIPWLDNLLDTVSSPAAVVAGVIVTASVITDMDPLMRWSLALIAGGGVAGTVQSLTVGSRQVSTVLTAGFGNPVISTLEAGSSIFMSVISLLAPVFALVLVVVLILGVGRWVRRRRAAAT